MGGRGSKSASSRYASVPGEGGRAIFPNGLGADNPTFVDGRRVDGRFGMYGLPRGSNIKTSWADLYELGEKVGGPDPTSLDRTTNYEITDLPLNAGLGSMANRGVYGGRVASANELKLGHTYVVDAYNHKGGVLAVYAGTERGYFGNDSVGLVFRAIGGDDGDSFEIHYNMRVVSGPDAKIAGEVYRYKGSRSYLKRG